MSRRKQATPHQVADENDKEGTSMKDVSQTEERELGPTETSPNLPVPNTNGSTSTEHLTTKNHDPTADARETRSKVMSEEGDVSGQSVHISTPNEAESGHLGNKGAAMLAGMPQLGLLGSNPYMPLYPMTLTPGLFEGVSERDRILWRNTCPYCYAVKAGPADLQRHLRKHTGERPFVCEVCNKAFKAKRSLQYHQYVHHGIEQAQSNLGDKYTDRKRKMEIEPGEKEAASPVNHFMKSFYAASGSGMQSEGFSPLNPPAGMFPWLHPGLMWNTLKRTMTPVANGLESQDENGNKKLLTDANRIPTATDASSVHTNNNGLMTPDLESKFKVGELEAGLPVNGSHDSSHSGLAETGLANEMPVERENRLVFGRDIEEYLKLRECPFCGKVCPQRSDMKRHLLVHTGEKPFTCEMCGKGFKAKGSLMYHQRAAHDMNVELSQGLEERFLRARANKEHRQMQHITSAPYANGVDMYDEDEVDVELAELERSGLDQAGTSGEISEALRDGENGGTGTGNSSGTSDLTPPSSSEKVNSREQSGQSSRGQGDGEGQEDDVEEYEDYTLDYPSEFPGLKQSISIKNETVLATRLDGVNQLTGDKVSMYKCHMCGRVFNFLSRLQCHLSLHFDRHLTVYQCALCRANFRFKLQLMRHLRNHGNRHDYASPPATSTSSRLEGETRSPPDGNSPPPVLEGKEANVSGSQDGSQSTNQSVISDGGLDEAGEPHTVRYSSYGRAESLMRQYNRAYVCRYCNKSFFRLFSLQRHERVHSRYKPCHCADCGRGFNQQRNLRHHMDSFHGNDGPELSSMSRNLLSGLSQSSQRLSSELGEDGDKVIEIVPTRDASSPPIDTTLPNVTANTDVNTETADQPTDLSSGRKRDLADQPPNDIGNNEEDEIEPGEIRHIPRHDPEGVATPASKQHPKELANEIREKERLGDDVTVVIPTDAPLEAADSNLETPCSNASETPSWGENASDTDSSLSNEIVSPPWKSIMAYNKQMKSKRKGSLPQRMQSPDHQSAENKSRGDVEPSPTPSSESMPTLSLPKFTSSPLAFSSPAVTSVLSPGLLPGAEQLAAAVAAANSTGPLYLPSPVLPPGMLPAQLPLMSTPAALASTATALEALASSQLSSQLTSSALPFGLPSISWPSTPATTSSHTDSQLSTSAPHSHSSYSRSSSLSSRTHSRRGRLNVVRTPVRREDACKPTVLPDGRTVYRCSYCNKDFGSYSDINRHMDFHEDIRPYKCKFCDYYARTNSQLKVHMMRHQGIREFHCKLCNYKGVTQSDLNRHMKSQIHMMKAQNECRLCGEGFVSPKNLEKHMMTCQGIRRDSRHSGRIHDDL